MRLSEQGQGEELNDCFERGETIQAQEQREHRAEHRWWSSRDYCKVRDAN